MDVDLSALKALERDKEISMEVLLGALSDALLNAYEKTPGAVTGATTTSSPRRNCSGYCQASSPGTSNQSARISGFRSVIACRAASATKGASRARSRA